MGKALLRRKNTVKAIVAVLIVVVVSLLLEGCSAYVEAYKNLEEEERQREEEIEKEAKEKQLSNCLEQIYNSYLSAEDEKLVQEFDNFLEESFGDKERLLNCLKRQKIYNSVHEEKNKIQGYLTEEEIEILENAEEDLIKLYNKYF